MRCSTRSLSLFKLFPIGVGTCFLLIVAVAIFVRSQEGGEEDGRIAARFYGSLSSTHDDDDPLMAMVRRAAYMSLPPVDECSADLSDVSALKAEKSCGSPLSPPCFDHTRCSAQQPPTMYVYDHACSLANSSELIKAEDEVPEDRDRMSSYWRAAASDAGLLAESYSSACLFVHVNQRVDYEPCAPKAPLWRSGANHVMVDITDKSRKFRRTVAGSLAMEAAANIHTCHYRSGYDISVPLPPRKHYPILSDTPPSDRDFFLTVKGTAYITGGPGSAERMTLVPLHDPANGVIVVMHCFDGHDAQLLPKNKEYCDHLQSTYGDFDYDALMNTTFGVVPAGRSPASFRLGEVMSAGAIPVFIGTSTVRPFLEQYVWSSFSFVFSPYQVGPRMVEALRAVPRDELEEMQRKSLLAYREIFGGPSHRYDAVARRVVDVLGRRITHHRR